MIETKSEKLNGITSESSSPSIKPVVTFQVSIATNTSIPLEKISTYNDNTTRATVRKPSLVSISRLKLTRYRLAVAFGICCIVMLFLLPIIFFYVEDNSGTTIDFDSFVMDIGIVNVSQSTFCNESMILNCSDDLVYTYEALRLASQYPFCVNKVEEQFTKLQNCGNDSRCVESIMCQEVRQQYCTAEWRVLELNESEGLIDCTNYGETAPLNCSDQFGLTNNGSVCLPLCAEFSQYSETYTAFFPYWLLIFSGLNVFGGIISLVISVYKIKKLFQFPQILIIANSILISILSLLILISAVSLESGSLLCSSDFLFDAFDEPTVFCHIQGFAYFTIINLYCYFWFLFILNLFVRVTNPLKMTQFEQSSRAKKIHIIEVIVAVLLATIPYVVQAVNSDFHFAIFPPIFCTAEPEYNFYGYLIPTVLIICVTLILMLFVLYTIHLRKGIFRRSGGSCKFCCLDFSVPEVKISLIFCYLLLMMVLLWTNFSIENARFSTISSLILTYAQCMCGGIRKELDCESYRRDFEAESHPELVTAVFTLFSFLSYSNLPFLIQFKTVIHFLSKSVRKKSSKKLTQQNN